ncbi:MAG: hypothetical protein WCP95_00625 [Actinomycetes bacterium]
MPAVVIKRILVGLLAAVLLLAGGAAAAAAIWAYSTFGMNGLMSFDAGTIAPGSTAKSTILDIDKFGATVPYIGAYGTTTLSVTSDEPGDSTQTLFIGAAKTEAVDGYVKGTPYAVAIRDGSEWTTRDVPGTGQPALPRTQTFWDVQAVGARPSIVVPDQRPLTLVVMHPSAIPSGPVTLSIDFTVRNASQWITGLAIASGILLLLGILALVVLFRMRGRKGRHQGDLPTEDQPIDG